VHHAAKPQELPNLNIVEDVCSRDLLALLAKCLEMTVAKKLYMPKKKFIKYQGSKRNMSNFACL